MQPGDRIEIAADYSHEGATTAFTFEVRWGATTLVSRSPAAGESAVTTRGNAAVHGSATQWSSQNWGVSTALAAGVGSAPNNLASALTIDFRGQMAAAGSDTVTLRNYSVVRYPVTP